MKRIINRNILLLSLIMLCIVSITVHAMEVDEIIRKLDRNEVYDTIRYNGMMIIYNEGKKYDKSFNTYAKGNDNFFMEFTNQDDIGTKYMKKEGRLYVYSDDLEKVLPITGHMLKESMMGSDLSYEDTVENDKLIDLYSPVIIEETWFEGDTRYKGTAVWVIKLIPRIPYRISIADFTARVMDKLSSKRKKERTAEFINTYFSKDNKYYYLRNNLDDEDRIKVHYKLSSLKYIKSAPYGKQLIVVSKDKIAALQIEMYSASGKNKIKEILLLDAKDINGRYFPVELQIRNLLRNDTKTVFQMNNIELDIPITDNMFNLRNLEN